MKFDKEILTQKLYNLGNATYKTLKDKNTWKLLGLGAVVYGAPVLYRYLTGDSTLPGIPLLPETKYTSSNIIEKLIVNYIVPGGIGGCVSQKFFEYFKDEKIEGKLKYLARLPGALAFIGGLTLIQTCGLANEFWANFPTGIPWEPEKLYPFNFIYGTFAGLTAKDTFDYFKNIFKKDDKNDSNTN